MSKKINNLYSDLIELIRNSTKSKKKTYFYTIHILIIRNIII